MKTIRKDETLTPFFNACFMVLHLSLAPWREKRYGVKARLVRPGCVHTMSMNTLPVVMCYLVCRRI